MSRAGGLLAPAEKPTIPAPACPASSTRVAAPSAGAGLDSLLKSVRTYHAGSLDQVPRLVVPLHELRSLSLDHEAGFILSRIDGTSTLESLLDICGMPRWQVLRLVAKLADYGVIRLDPRGRP